MKFWEAAILCSFSSLLLLLVGVASAQSVASIVTRDVFDEILPRRNSIVCPARDFYTYEAFIQAADYFGGFATYGDETIRRREIAAFLAQTSYETRGGLNLLYRWGYCIKEQVNPSGSYCVPAEGWPCAEGKTYWGRGPFQITYNCNYGPAGVQIGENLLDNPDLVASDPVISFKVALWFWMNYHRGIPPCHAVITGLWTPTPADIAAGRLPGFGTCTNVIDGATECGKGPNQQNRDRIGFYRRICDILGVSYGDNLDCADQAPFSNTTGCADPTAYSSFPIEMVVA